MHRGRAHWWSHNTVCTRSIITLGKRADNLRMWTFPGKCLISMNVESVFRSFMIFWYIMIIHCHAISTTKVTSIWRSGAAPDSKNDIACPLSNHTIPKCLYIAQVQANVSFLESETAPSNACGFGCRYRMTFYEVSKCAELSNASLDIKHLP